MLNLLTVLSVRLLAGVPTVLAVPVLEMELVFKRTLSLLSCVLQVKSNARILPLGLIKI